MKKIFIHFYLLRTPRRAWSFSGFFTLFIFASSPFVPLVAQWLRGHHLLKLFLFGLLAAFLAYILGYFLHRLKIRNPLAYGCVGLLLALAACLMVGNRSMAERIHILEYAFLALLFFKASKFHFHGILLYAIPLLLALWVGWLDELWQGWLPERVYDIQDVCDNAAGAMLGIGMAWIRQKYGREVKE